MQPAITIMMRSGLARSRKWGLGGNDVEPIAWVVERQEQGNSVTRRDFDLEEGSKFENIDYESSRRLPIS